MKNHLIAGFGTTQFWYGYDREAYISMREAVCSYGIRMIDTAEMYGDGRCEEAVGRLIRDIGRDELMIVDKILPDNAHRKRFFRSLDASLSRLGTGCIDLYLLHWRENADLQEVSELMEEAKKAGKIRAWGVSNFDVQDMEDLLACPQGKYCEANQIFYNPDKRGSEFDLLPYLQERNIGVMAYSSLDSRAVRNRLAADERVRMILEKEGITIEALMIAFVIAHGVTPLFQTRSRAHLKDNCAGLSFDIQPYMSVLDAVCPPPVRKVPLAKQ